MWRRSDGCGVMEAGGAVPGQGREILVLGTPDATDGPRSCSTRGPAPGGASRSACAVAITREQARASRRTGLLHSLAQATAACVYA